jgi:hypothetical protein
MRHLLFLLALSVLGPLSAKTARYRLMVRGNPAQEMVVGWDQLSGKDPVLYYDTRDHGEQWSKYRFQKKTDRTVSAKGMQNCFARLSGLQSATIYYFVIRDSEGNSLRYCFRTLPAETRSKISLIAGGDSRNHREARQNANRLVAKLRPDAVLFGGDMTFSGTPEQWIEWFDDWQMTISADARLYPVVVSRGNHEADNQVLVDLFDVPSPDVYYSVPFCGDLLQVFTLNTLIPTGGAQRDWLEKELKNGQGKIWRLVQYHHPMRPHVARKTERDDLVAHWAPLFAKYNVQLAVECDAHVAKYTWPLVAATGKNAHEGFVRDDANGTVYIGEGGWGAPLRPANDAKPWTRDCASLNHVHWIFVDRDNMVIRTLQTDNAPLVSALTDADRFSLPKNLSVWTPSNGGVLTLWPVKTPQKGKN